jgi:hypothetical protein
MITINSHEIVLDPQERLESWTSYDRVLFLAMNFIKHCPIAEHNQLPWYLQYSCFWTDPIRPTVWPDNPAGKFAWAVTTLLKYYPYTGDSIFIEIVRKMLDRLWEYRTPEHFSWKNVPYASAHPGTGVYFGARADGEFATECDKIAQAGRAFVDFYELTLEEHYLLMGRKCADELVRHLRSGDETHSPLPFRIDVCKGAVIEEYTADMIQVVRLFDELIRLGETRYQSYRDEVWGWINQYPLKNNIWKGYFEDIRIDPENANRDQLSAMETARYILENRNKFPDWKESVKGLIDWVRETLGGPPFYTAIPIHEQKFCYFPMGSHTARFASINCLYAAASGDAVYREQGIRSFNWATYMANKDGTVTVGVDRPDYYNQCWFTDGYFDYVPHFLDGMAAIPELAPLDSDHLLSSTSVIQFIDYQPYQINYRVFYPLSRQKFRLTYWPTKVSVDGKLIPKKDIPDNEPSWFVEDEELRVFTVQAGGKDVTVSGRE